MSESLRIDFEQFKKQITKPAKARYDITKLDSFKKHHKSVYVIALLLTKLKEKHTAENEYSYLQEIVSDLLYISRFAVLSFELPCLIILRRIIENFYNHTYYYDHKIEFLHLQNGKNEYTPIDRLKLYFDTHPVFLHDTGLTFKEYNQNLFNEYHDLCKIVHTKGTDAMNLASTLKEINAEMDINVFFKRVTQITLFISYLIYKFHKSIRLTPVEKNVFVSLIPSDKRSNLDD